MATPIRYQFSAAGHDEVAAAFRSVAAAASQSSRAVTTTTTAADRHARGAARATRAETARWREVERTAKKIEAEFAREARAAEKSAAAKVKAEERAAAARVRAEAQASRQIDRQRTRDERDAMRRRVAAERAAAREARRAGADGILGLTGARVASIAGGAATVGVGLTGAAGRQALALHELANRISINARQEGQAAVDPGMLRREFELTAIRTPGVTADDVARGTGAFVTKTGNLDQARRFSRSFATTAAATGASVEDVAGMGAELAQKFRIQTEEEMRQALAAVTFGGKAGAFEVRDAAAKYAKLASAGSGFGLDTGVAGVRTLQGLSQIAMGATGDRDVAATSVEAMLRQLKVESGNIEKRLGVKVFTDKGKTQTRDVRDILTETIGATGGNQVKLQDVFKDEGGRMIQPLAVAFRQGAEAAGKHATAAERRAAGEAAVRAELDRAINATAAWTEVQRDAAQRGQDASARATQAWETFVAGVGEEVLPALSMAAQHLDLLAVAASPATEAVSGLLSDLGSIGTSIKRVAGIQSADERRALSPEERLAEVHGELGELARRETLSGRQKVRRRQLLDEQTEIEEEIRLSKPPPAVKSRAELARELIGEPGQRLVTEDDPLARVIGPRRPESDKRGVAVEPSTAETVGASALKGLTDAFLPSVTSIVAKLAEVGAAAEALSGAKAREAKAAESAASALERVGRAQGSGQGFIVPTG